jgi:hypothetical protein
LSGRRLVGLQCSPMCLGMGEKAHADSAARANAAQTGNAEARSNYGTLLGGEFPKGLYRSVVIAFGAIVAVSWVAFGGSDDSDLTLGFASVLAVVFFALPIVMHSTAAARSGDKPVPLDTFLRSRVEIATGALTGKEAWLQVLIIPLSLAFAAVAIGAVYLLVA